MRKYLFLFLETIVMLSIFTGCEAPGGGSTTVSVSAVSLSETALNLVVGDGATLTATVTPDNATNKNVSWSSGNTAVATVTANGNVTGVAAGTAVVRVMTADGGFTDTCNVTVSAIHVTGWTSPKPTSVSISTVRAG